MTATLELEAKNIEQAVRLACSKLNIPRNKLRYDVISHGSSGIFGLGRTRKARIRVVIPETSEPRNRTSHPTGNVAHDKSGPMDGTVANEFHTGADAVFTLRQADRSTSPGISDESSRELGKTVLQRIVDAITTEAHVTWEEDSDRLLYHIKGGNSGMLIGRHGQTLEAMQALVEKVVNKNHRERVRVLVDIEGYLETRKSNLIRHASQLAVKCKRIRKPVTVGYMNAHDRRIIHMALKEDQEIRTHSTGDGHLRKLVIYPRKNSFQRRRTNL
jgi:spoIIIJ-associated protein